METMLVKLYTIKHFIEHFRDGNDPFSHIKFLFLYFLGDGLSDEASYAMLQKILMKVQQGK